MDYTVYIPTKGRTSVDLKTLQQVLAYSNINPVIVCPKAEAETFQSQYLNLSIKVVDKKYLGQVWQTIVEECPTTGVMILDDDLRFAVRYLEIHDWLEQVAKKELDEMFQWMEDQLDAGYAHGAISIRKGNHFQENSFRDCGNAKDCLYFNRDVLLKENTRLDRLKTMQDFDITLQLMSLGYPNRVGFNWCCDQIDPAAEGGTTLYRTPDVQKEAAEQLHEFWPNFVKVVKKKAASKADIYGDERYDVKITWRKCWNHRDRNHQQVITIPEAEL